MTQNKLNLFCILDLYVVFVSEIMLVSSVDLYKIEVLYCMIKLKCCIV